jgi:hypothetical protein
MSYVKGSRFSDQNAIDKYQDLSRPIAPLGPVDWCAHLEGSSIGSLSPRRQAQEPAHGGRQGNIPKVPFHIDCLVLGGRHLKAACADTTT